MSVNRLFENFNPENYKIFLDLTKGKKRIFDGEVEVSGRAKNDREIVLHAKDLDVLSVEFEGENLKFEFRENDELAILAGDKTFSLEETLRIKIKFSGKITDAMHGLYPCYYKENGEKKELFATQFESHHAREVFPCIDEPEAKATFDLTLKTPRGVEVLANTSEIYRVEDDNCKTLTFEKTPKMSTYLLAFAIGDLQKKSARTKSGVQVNVWATRAQSPELLDFPLEIATKVLEFYEEYFDEKFPLSKCDHIALPDFSSGAMENWGLITYRETAMLAGKNSSISSKKYVALVIAHETAHQWFGNLVTMKWWDELWLNESFATMMEYFAVDNIKPEWSIWEEFAVNEAILSLRRDAIDGVQAVHVPVHQPDEISTIFDGAIVYAKGARLMNMLRNFVGDKAFRDGLRSYFKNFKYQNTVGQNLWDCLSESSGKNVAEFMNAWILRSGYPSILAEEKGEKLCLHQKQFFVGEGQDTGKIWPILLRSNQDNLPEIMDTEKLESEFSGDFVQLNEGNISHFISNYSSELFEKLLTQIKNLDTISRLQILQERSLLARGGAVSSADLLKTLRFYRDETSLNVWDMMTILLGDIRIFLDEGSPAEAKMKQFCEELARGLFKILGFEKKENETEEQTELRPTILGQMIYAENADALARADQIFDENATNISKIDAEIRPIIISAKVRYWETPELISNLLNLYKNTADVDFRNDILAGITSTKNPKTVEILLKNLTNPQVVRPQDIVGWFVQLLRNQTSREQTWAWMRENWAQLCQIFDGDKSYSDFPRYAGAILRTEKHLAEFVEFFKDKKSDPSLKRSIEMGEREIAGRIDLIAREKQGVEAELLR
ncbi:MAG: M1 family metallopeptidase [bacterium]|nr:M1 family metallopeptidase [bacterium]